MKFGVVCVIKVSDMNLSATKSGWVMAKTTNDRFLGWVSGLKPDLRFLLKLSFSPSFDVNRVWFLFE